jgi:hypothetical protein
MHRTSRARTIIRLALTACLALALLAPAAPAAGAEGTVTYTHESLKAYEQQLAAGQIRSATFNKRVRSVHLTLKDGRHMLAKYAAHEEPKLAAQLKAKGVPVTVEKPAEALKELKNKPVHHKLRYIVGGIVVAVIVVVGAVLLIDRRRKAARE